MILTYSDMILEVYEGMDSITFKENNAFIKSI